MPNGTCATTDCTTDAAGRGKYCSPHSPWRARGIPLKQRILDRTQVLGADECWHWTGRVRKDGRGLLRHGALDIAPHRFFYEEAFGPIPKGLRLGADCSDRACVNPAHQLLSKSGKQPTAAPTRFWSMVNKTAPSGCWTWTGSINTNGYGTLYIDANQRHAYAHRFAYSLLVGDIPAGAEIDHTCHTRSCVNPAHFRLATHRLNSQNRSGPPVNNKSGHLGVYFETRSQRWVAQVKHRGQVVLFKYFDTKEAAAEAAVDARNEHFIYNILDRV